MLMSISGVMPGGRGPEPRGYAMNGDVDPRDLQDNYRDVSSHFLFQMSKLGVI